MLSLLTFPADISDAEPSPITEKGLLRYMIFEDCRSQMGAFQKLYKRSSNRMMRDRRKDIPL